MSGNITLKGLAKMAGVSVSTVSKALANSPEISDATKNKIKELAKECHYRPNYIAQSLKSSSTKTIGVIIPDILNFFFVKILHSIEETGRKMGYKIITCISNESLQTEKENIDILTNGSVDGLILSVTTETQKLNEYKHIQQVINNQLPVVLFDKVTDTLNCCRITSDNYQGAFMAVE